MSVSVTKVRTSVADLTDDVVADILSDAAAGFVTDEDKVEALCNALMAQRRGMRNVMRLYTDSLKANLDLKKEIKDNFAIHARVCERMQVQNEVARRHALKMRQDALTELNASAEFEAALEALIILARKYGVTEDEIDAAIIEAGSDVSTPV